MSIFFTLLFSFCRDLLYSLNELIKREDMVIMLMLEFYTLGTEDACGEALRVEANKGLRNTVYHA